MKKNLAKVLGLEELQEAAPPVPSDEQVMQQQTVELSDYMQQTADATEVAAEHFQCSAATVCHPKQQLH